MGCGAGSPSLRAIPAAARRASGWGARIRTWDPGIKTRCLAAWPRPNLPAREGGKLSGRRRPPQGGHRGGEPGRRRPTSRHAGRRFRPRRRGLSPLRQRGRSRLRRCQTCGPIGCPANVPGTGEHRRRPGTSSRAGASRSLRRFRSRAASAEASWGGAFEAVGVGVWALAAGEHRPRRRRDTGIGQHQPARR